MEELSINDLIELIAATRPAYDHNNNENVFSSEKTQELHEKAVETLVKKLK